ncbi:MAG TPA: hypothetical protein VG101_05130 [Puia sp.]|jgi:hypothetical protein|nr:hypothetical protein [Puia sp.]
MKQSVFFTLLCILTGTAVPARSWSQTIDKARFYSAMASGNLEETNNELSIVAASTIKEKEAYTGALLMRKAGMLTRAKEKLATFKSGYAKMERSIALDSANIEYRFLRLIIQEHAPRVVHYDKDREKDSRAIIQSFPTLPPVLQKAILNYCPHSKLLHERELNG